MGEVLGWATSLEQPLRNPHPLLAAVLTSTKATAQLTAAEAAALQTQLPPHTTLVETPMVHAARSAVRQVNTHTLHSLHTLSLPSWSRVSSVTRR